MDAPFLFAGANQPLPGILMRGQEQVGEARHSMSDHVVNVADHPIAGTVMRRCQPQVCATQGHRDRFFAVRGRQQPIGPARIDDVSQHLQLSCGALDSRGIAVRINQALDSFDNGNAVSLDLFDRIPMQR